MAKLITGNGRECTAYNDSINHNFSYLGRSGVIKNVGDEVSANTDTVNVFGLNSGLIMLQGKLIDVVGNETIAIPEVTGSTIYYTTIYLELDMSTIEEETKQGTVTLKKLESTTSYPSIPTSDNLVKEKLGKA